MDDSIDILGDAQVILTLNENSSYQRVELDASSREKTALTAHHWLYQFIPMSFGFRTKPVTLQRVMDILRSSVKLQFPLHYLDDIAIFSRTLRRHINHTRPVLSFLNQASFTSEIEKVRIAHESDRYGGHVIRPG